MARMAKSAKMAKMAISAHGDLWRVRELWKSKKSRIRLPGRISADLPTEKVKGIVRACLKSLVLFPRAL